MSGWGFSQPYIYYIYVRYKASRDTNISTYFEEKCGFMSIQFFLDVTMWPKNTVSHPRRMCVCVCVCVFVFSNIAVRTSLLTYGLILIIFLRHMTRFHSKT